MTKSHPISFTKMHGLGNDFVIIEDPGITQITREQISVLSDRHIGIGFDQLLAITQMNQPNHFYCQIFNADGTEAEQCGNGLRCVARYLKDKHAVDSSIFIKTKGGTYPASLLSNGQVSLNMGIPSAPKVMVLDNVETAILSLGNPHAILKVDDIHASASELIATKLYHHPHFTQGINVGLVEIVNDHHLKLKTFERGSGETLACGSNACAAAVVAVTQGWIGRKESITVEFSLGPLAINWPKDDEPLIMCGPATKVFEGNILLNVN